eukprot:TRINITY_DN5983_c0_g1_i1.p1 TRINITY_DN5983_c0_g1~~TRINITY_DN5983_c0_g1_i1.p1  ORF type:complete len:120 (-),score=20.86 TRINITY_DN5983_c0_g1_i1:27-359(-)
MLKTESSEAVAKLDAADEQLALLLETASETFRLLADGESGAAEVAQRFATQLHTLQDTLRRCVEQLPRRDLPYTRDNSTLRLSTEARQRHVTAITELLQAWPDPPEHAST